MGWMRHHAIIVTSWDAEKLHAARMEAIDIGLSVSPMTAAAINGYRSFLVAPDGSKEGWDESDLDDERRNKFVEWLSAQAYDDGSSHLAWVEVQFGDEDGETRIVRDSDEYKR